MRAVTPTINVANVLTLVRLLLVPLFLVALFLGGDHQVGWQLGWRWVATVIFVVASATDQLDGWLARRYDLVTDFGKVADPIADKALIGAALVGLSVLGELEWWVTIVIAVREILVTALRFWVIRYGVIAANIGGKAKTIIQMVAIMAYLLPLPPGVETIKVGLMGIAVVVTVLSGVDYAVRAVRLRIASGDGK